jgi:N-acetylneuraminate synthase
MTHLVKLGDRMIGPGRPVFTVAEIGINHNGNIANAVRLIELSAEAGFDAVKFQKRTPVLCVPDDQRCVMRETPWGAMTYMEYRERVEFGTDEYTRIDQVCRELGIMWFASCWDKPSVDFIERFDPPVIKIASACLTDDELLIYIRNKNRPVILSTGMSTMDEIRHAVSLLDSQRLILAHATSSYPCDTSELNLRMIQTLKDTFPCPVGYSGHEKGRLMTCVAVGAGAQIVERHITLDKTSWGSDQAASLDPGEFKCLIQEIRDVELGLGDGAKRIYETELPVLRKLRGCGTKRLRTKRMSAEPVSTAV